MSTKTLKNISVAQFQAFLDLAKCNYAGTKGGHEKWVRADLLRPVIFQTHVKPIPEFIVKNNLRVLGYTKKDFFEILEGKAEVKREGDKFILEKVIK